MLSCCLKWSFSLTLCEIPWRFSSILPNVKTSLTLCKIPWQFPDLEKFYFSLTFPWRLWTLTGITLKYWPTLWKQSEGFDSCDRPNLTQIGFKSLIFQPICDLEILLMTYKSYRAPLLHYIKLCASTQTPWWIRTGVTVWKCSIRVKMGDFLPCMTIKFDGWPWTRQIWGIWKLRPAYSPETPNLGQNRWCFVPCDLEIWWMTLENNRASLLCCFKLCATFHSHWWIQTRVTVRKHPIWVKLDDFF